eukprot:scaffold48455_cov19-Tisochrysis_lutea.AAC.1
MPEKPVGTCDCSKVGAWAVRGSGVQLASPSAITPCIMQLSRPCRPAPASKRKLGLGGGGGFLGGSLLDSLTFKRDGNEDGSRQRARPKGLTLPGRRK